LGRPVPHFPLEVIFSSERKGQRPAQEKKGRGAAREKGRPAPPTELARPRGGETELEGAAEGKKKAARGRVSGKLLPRFA